MENSKLINFIFHYHPSTKCMYRIGLSAIFDNGCCFMKWLLFGKVCILQSKILLQMSKVIWEQLKFEEMCNFSQKYVLSRVSTSVNCSKSHSMSDANKIQNLRLSREIRCDLFASRCHNKCKDKSQETSPRKTSLYQEFLRQNLFTIWDVGKFKLFAQFVNQNPTF